MVFLRSTEIQEYNIIPIHIKYIKINHRRFEEAFNKSITQINKVNKLLSWDIVIFLNSLRGIPDLNIPNLSGKYRKLYLRLEFYFGF